MHAALKSIFQSAILVTCFAPLIGWCQSDTTLLNARLTDCTTVKNDLKRSRCIEVVARDAIAQIISNSANLSYAGSGNVLSEQDEARKLKIAAMKANVASKLLDPSAAQFRNVFINMGSYKVGTTVICGEINSKNAYGAYVGFKRFYAVNLEPDLNSVNIDSPNFELFVWDVWCNKPGEKVF